jgi:hypothetical protein
VARRRPASRGPFCHQDSQAREILSGLTAVASRGTPASGGSRHLWGVWSSRGGYEYNLVLLAAVFGLTENGPGEWSVDALLGRSWWGTRWALAALVAGAAGSAAVLAAKQESKKDVPQPAPASDREPATAAS